MQIARSKSSWGECLLLAFVPAVLAVISVGLLLLSVELGRGGYGDGGGGGGEGGGGDGDDDLPRSGPNGGLTIYWDAFEADFRAYAEQHERVRV